MKHVLPALLCALRVACCSFWPQVFTNYKRKSVEGLSFDFTGVCMLCGGVCVCVWAGVAIAARAVSCMQLVYMHFAYLMQRHACASEPSQRPAALTPLTHDHALKLHACPAAPAAFIPCLFLHTVMNVLGFACYTQFNLSLFLSPTVRQEYEQRFSTTDIPVELNDVVFGIHALIMSSVMAVQCLIYPKHDNQRVSLGTSLGMAASVTTGLGLAGYLAIAGEHCPPFTWLDL